MEAVNKETQPQLQELIKRRIHQRSEDRLCEYLLGIGLNDPNLEKHIHQDRLIIKDKYGLPNNNLLLSNPQEYYSVLRKMAKNNGTDVQDIGFLNKIGSDTPSGMGAAFVPELNIVVNRPDDGERHLFVESLRRLEHELIHAFQRKKYPRLTPEMKEYEAYVAIVPEDEIDSSNIRSMFEGGILASVRQKCKQISDGQCPGWDNPFWFLKNIDNVDIEEPKFIPVNQVDSTIFNWDPGKGELAQVRQILHELVGKKWETYYHEIFPLRLEFDRAEIRQRYGLPKYRGPSMEKYVDQLLSLATKLEIKLEVKDSSPNNFREWKTVAKDLDEQFIRAMQAKQNKTAVPSKFQLEYEVFVGAQLELSSHSGLESDLAWYMDDKKSYEY